jgi:hypothetical protein
LEVILVSTNENFCLQLCPVWSIMFLCTTISELDR